MVIIAEVDEADGAVVEVSSVGIVGVPSFLA
jgi:hypothetical protein